MKKYLFACCFTFLFVSGSALAQDTLVLVNENVIPCKVLKVKNSSIDYQKRRGESAPVYNINKSLVHYIIYNSGEIDTITREATFGALDSATNTSSNDSSRNLAGGYNAGYLAGFSEYRNPGNNACSGVSGALCLYLGWITPVVIVTKRIRPEELTNTSYSLSNDEDYKRGFIDGATKARNRQAWRSYGIGLGAAVAVVVAATLLSF